jgi:hypothetical protein
VIQNLNLFLKLRCAHLRWGAGLHTIIKYSTFLNINSNNKKFGKLYFSSKGTGPADLNINLKPDSENLDPYWITGFSDAESCFSIIISKRNNLS